MFSITMFLLISLFLFVHLIGSVGLTLIVTEGRIFEGLRNNVKRFFGEKMHEMITCNQCAGFWIGSILSIPLIDLMHFYFLNTLNSYGHRFDINDRLPFVFTIEVIVWLFVCFGGMTSVLSMATRTILDWYTFSTYGAIDDVQDPIHSEEATVTTGNKTSDIN